MLQLGDELMHNNGAIATYGYENRKINGLILKEKSTHILILRYIHYCEDPR
jgi:hypothetical protein